MREREIRVQPAPRRKTILSIQKKSRLLVNAPRTSLLKANTSLVQITVQPRDVQLLSEMPNCS